MRNLTQENNTEEEDIDELYNSTNKLSIIYELLNKLQDYYNIPLQTNNGIFYVNDVKAIRLVYN